MHDNGGTLKLLIASTSFPLKPGDSLSPFLWEFCQRLKARGWEITAVVPHHEGILQNEIWDGIEIIRFKYLPERFENLAYSGGLLPNLKKDPLKLLKLPFFIYSMYRTMMKLSLQRRFDLVNIHWLFPASFWLNRFVRKSGLPVVLTGHGTDIHLAVKFPFSILAGSALKASSALTVNSDYMKDIIGDRSYPGGAEVIPMGIDINKFKPSEKNPSESKTILFIGRLIKQKGIELLLDSFMSLKQTFPEAELEIIGYGPEKRTILQKIESSDLSDSAKILNALDHGKLTEKYLSARVLALPSLIGEGFGMTAAEAAACGVPTITFGLGGTSELVINEETGLIVKPDVQSLTEGLTRFFSDGHLTDRLGKSARDRIEKYFSWDIISDKFDRLFREIIKNRIK